MTEMMEVTSKHRSHRFVTLLAAPLFAVLTTAASAQIVPPTAPILTLDDGNMLVNLARRGMDEFIESRTPADKQTIPNAMKGLTSKFHPATVTLRSSGQLLSRSFRADTNVCRSVLAAALDAMRSSNLPDRVTPSVLAGMTVEVEIHGKSRAISPCELDTCVVQGLTGVTVSRGPIRGSLLPSTGCGMGLSPKQIRVVCLAQLPESGSVSNRSNAWTIFTSKHYVGYPDKAVVQLYRGKILIPPQALTQQALLETASVAGLFLANSQTAEGAYSGQNRKPAIHEHLYATYAMAKLAKRDKRKLFSASVNRALQYAARFVIADEKQARVLTRSSGVQTAESPTRATAWLLLVISELPEDPAYKKLGARLARALQQDVVSVVGPDHGLATPAQLDDWSVALMALRSFLPRNEGSSKLLAPLVKTMQAWSKSGQTLSPLVFRGLGGAIALPKWRQIDDSDLPDRRGGFVSSRSEPTTFDT
ncbi:MAG: hypothetical protein QGH94_08400, partial [Phycisphaerae bacterium]|nr:hypothetical protein [Phycisphaerae bacterium]